VKQSRSKERGRESCNADFETVNQSMMKGIKQTLAEFGLLDRMKADDIENKDRKDYEHSQINYNSYLNMLNGPEFY